MAKGRIDYNDLVANDLKSQFTDLFDTINKGADKAEDTFKKMLKASVDVNKQMPSTNKEIQAFNKALIEQQKAVIGLEKVEQSRLKTKQQAEVLNQKTTKSNIEEKKAALQSIKVKQQEHKLTTQQLKEKERLLRLEEKATKQKKKEALAQEKLNSKYEQAKIKLAKLAKELKEVAFVEGKNSKATRKLAKDYDLLRNKVFKAEKVAGEFQRNVGNYPKVMGKAAGALRSMGLAIGGLAIIRNIFTTVKDFEQSIANLSAITGATGKDLDFFKNKAIELGRSTTLSAGQVAEGFKLIASAKPELLDNAEALAFVTEQAIILAEAAGVDLPTAAKSLTLSLNQFGAGADEASKFIDVLAAGSKLGAGDVEFLNAAMLKVGGTADAAGLSFKDTVAALETLAPVLGTGEEAGTKFRNILASLQKEGLGFASGQFNLNDAIAETNKMLNDIQDPAEKAAARIQLFGKQNDAAGIQLLNNTKALEAFQISLDENGIALDQQATNNDTLQGSLKALSSAWEGFILDLEQGTGAFAGLKDILFFVADNLVTIVKVIGLAAGAFLTYKTVVLVSNSALKIYQATTIAFSIVQALLTGNIKSATAAMRLFNTAVKLSPIGVLLTLIGAAVTAYVLFADHATEAERTQLNFNKGIEAGTESAKKFVTELIAIGDEQRRLLNLEVLRGNITEPEAELSKIEILEGDIQRTTDAYLDAYDEIDQATIESEDRRIQIRKDGQEAIDLASYVSPKAKELAEIAVKANLNREQEFTELLIGEIQARANEAEKALDAAQEKLDEANATQVKKEKDKEDEITEEQKAAYAKRAKELSLYLIRLQDLQDAAIVSSFTREEAQLNRKFDRDIEAIKKGKKKLSDVEEKLVKALEEKRQKSLIELREKFQATEDTQRKTDDDKRKAEREKNNDEALQTDIDYFDSILDTKTKQLDILAKTEEVEASEYLDLELDKLVAELELLEIYGKDTTAKLKEIADKKHAIHLANIDEELAANEELARKKAEDLAKEKALLDERMQMISDGADAINDLLQKKADERIALLDKELAANQAFQAEIIALNQQGVISTEENIAFEKKKQAELELLKQQELELKAKRELVVTAVQTYAGYVQSGETGASALASTVTDIGVLKAFINTLDFFLDGTEDTGKVNGFDSNGGRLAVLHDNERVMTKEQNKMVSHLSNEELAAVGSNYSVGNANVNKAMANHRFQSNEDVIAMGDKIEMAIKAAASETHFNYDNIKDSFVRTVKTQNKIENIHFKKSRLW